MKAQVSLLLGVLVLVLASVAPAQTRSSGAGFRDDGGLSVEAVLRLPTVNTVGSTSLRPDGKQFAYTICDSVKQTAAWPTDPRDPHRNFTANGVPLDRVGCAIWITDTRTGKERKLTWGNANSWAPSWSPDGNHLAFYSDQDGISRLWVWESKESQFRRVSSEPTHGSDWNRPVWTPDSRFILAPMVPRDFDLETATSSLTESIAQALDKGPWKYPGATVTVFGGVAPAADRKVVTSSPEERVTRYRPGYLELAYVAVASGEVKRIGLPSPIVWYEISPDGQHVALARKTATYDGHEMHTLEIVSQTGERKELTDALDGLLPVGGWSPDGKQVAAKICCTTSEKGKRGTAIYLFSNLDGKPQGWSEVETGFISESLPVWGADSRQVYFFGRRRRSETEVSSLLMQLTTTNRSAKFFPTDPYWPNDVLRPARGLWTVGKNAFVFSAVHLKTKDSAFVGFEPVSGKLTPLWSGPNVFASNFAHMLGSEGVQISDDGQTIVAYLAASDHPRNFYAMDRSFTHATKITDIDPEMSRHRFGKSQLVSWTSKDGHSLTGLLLLPADYTPGKRYPTIVDLYPDSDFSFLLNAFGGSNFGGADNQHLWTTRGYAVLMVSTVVLPDEASMRSIANGVVPAVEKLIDMGIADPNAVGLRGGSFGGYGTLAVITQTNLFKAAVVSAGYPNLVSVVGELDNDGRAGGATEVTQRQHKLHATLWENPKLYIENSPVFYLDKVTTPVLIIHGTIDDHVQVSQARELYADLQQLGKEAMLRQYEGEGHVVAKFANAADSIYSQIEWFNKHLRGSPSSSVSSKDNALSK